MRIALVHDWLTGMRGGEKVLERLCALFPDAPIHTLVWKRGSVSRAIEAHPIRVSFLDHMPGVGRRYRWYLPLFPRAIESFDLSGFDAVISTSHAVAKSARVTTDAFHLSYVFTPMRYVWDLEAQYFPPGRYPRPVAAYIRRTCARLRAWDRATSHRAHIMLACSAHVARRIERHYGRRVEVLYPPVDLVRFDPARRAGDGDFYLVAGALAPYKRADLAIAACRRLGRKLVVVGSGPEGAGLRRDAGPDVEFRGWVVDDEMEGLYARARALLFPGEEDFGIVPVEALASGCPVVALARGGALETVGRGTPTPDLTRAAAGETVAVAGGVLCGAQTVDALVAGMRRLESTAYEPHALAALAEPFAAERFDREFLAAFEGGLLANRSLVRQGI